MKIRPVVESKTLAEILVELRAKRGLSQEQLAKRALGKPAYSTISNVEIGSVGLGIENRQRLAVALQLDEKETARLMNASNPKSDSERLSRLEALMEEQVLPAVAEIKAFLKEQGRAK